jgi:prefoldin subunit 5
LIRVAEVFRQQNGSLKAVNEALTGEINDLNNSIDQLKDLDRELEEKTH